MPIDKFNSQNIRDLRFELKEALRDISEKLGISLTYGHCRFGRTTATIRIEAAVATEDGKPQTKDEAEFRQYAESWGLLPDDLGKVFKMGGREYKIVGGSKRARRYKVFIQRIEYDGKTYKATPNSIRIALKNS